jgi:hypothetical protein
VASAKATGLNNRVKSRNKHAIVDRRKRVCPMTKKIMNHLLLMPFVVPDVSFMTQTDRKKLHA